ncbi:MAG: hypothetical protein WCN98_06290 [Verrucomicrobiaceae bacterium]
MKAFGIILLALLAAIIGYQFAYPRLETMFDLKKQVSIVPDAATGDGKSKPAKVQEPKSPPAPAGIKTVTPPAPDMPQTTDTPSNPTVSTGGGLGKAVDAVVGPDDFQPPTFPSLEDVVKGWKEIPKKAFPRQVKLLKEVEFKMSVGSSKVTSGGNATAIAQEGDNLIVAPTENSPARTQVSLEDTDLKDTLSRGYEIWKAQMVDWQRRQWEFRKAAAKEQNTIKTNPKVIARNDKPPRNPDGSYEILLTSMKTGQVTEITPSNIKKWGDLQITSINNKDYFTVIVNYTTKTMFGDFDTEAQARIMNGRVEKWVYTGSGEVVP